MTASLVLHNTSSRNRAARLAIAAEAMAIRAGHALAPDMPGRDTGFDLQRRRDAVKEQRHLRRFDAILRTEWEGVW